MNISKCLEVYIEGCELKGSKLPTCWLSLSFIVCSVHCLCGVCHADQTVFFHLGLLLCCISKSIEFIFKKMGDSFLVQLQKFPISVHGGKEYKKD